MARAPRNPGHLLSLHLDLPCRGSTGSREVPPGYHRPAVEVVGEKPAATCGFFRLPPGRSATAWGARAFTSPRLACLTTGASPGRPTPLDCGTGFSLEGTAGLEPATEPPGPSPTGEATLRDGLLCQLSYVPGSDVGAVGCPTAPLPARHYRREILRRGSGKAGRASGPLRLSPGCRPYCLPLRYTIRAEPARVTAPRATHPRRVTPVRVPRPVPAAAVGRGWRVVVRAPEDSAAAGPGAAG